MPTNVNQLKRGFAVILILQPNGLVILIRHMKRLLRESGSETFYKIDPDPYQRGPKPGWWTYSITRSQATEHSQFIKFLCCMLTSLTGRVQICKKDWQETNSSMLFVLKYMFYGKKMEIYMSIRIRILASGGVQMLFSAVSLRTYCNYYESKRTWPISRCDQLFFLHSSNYLASWSTFLKIKLLLLW